MSPKKDSATDIVYVKHTNSSAESGIVIGSEDPISFMNLIKNSYIILETQPITTENILDK